MGLSIRCPKCKSVIDASNSAPGSTVVCPDCSEPMRIPAADAPAKEAPKKGGRGASNTRGTSLFRRMSGARIFGSPGARGPSKFGSDERGGAARQADPARLLVGVGLVIGVAIVVLIIISQSGGPKAPPPRPKPTPTPTPYEEPSPSPTPTPTPEAFTPPPTPSETPRPTDPARVDFRRLAETFKNGGQVYEDMTRPEAHAMRELKRMSKKAAVEGLIPFFDDEDPAMVSSINAALNHLTGESMPRATAATRDEAKRRWVEWAAAQPADPK